MLNRRPYVAVQVNLADHTKTYNVLALVNAVIAAESLWDNSAECPGGAKEVLLQNDPGNAAAIRVGDGLLTAGASGRCGYSIALGGQRTYGGADVASVQVGSLYATSGTDNQKLNVEVMAG